MMRVQHPKRRQDFLTRNNLKPYCGSYPVVRFLGDEPVSVMMGRGKFNTLKELTQYPDWADHIEMFKKWGLPVLLVSHNYDLHTEKIEEMLKWAGEYGVDLVICPRSWYYNGCVQVFFVRRTKSMEMSEVEQGIVGEEE